MCTPQEEQIIRQEVGQWMQRGKMFTSVDIANSLKQRGNWIRNRDVASFLRDRAVDFSPQYGFRYKATPITVTLEDGSTTPAALYHPDGSDPMDYKRTNQRAMTPDEAKGDSPSKAQGKAPSPFSGIVASSTGVKVGLNAVPKAEEGESEIPPASEWVAGISSAEPLMARFEQTPTQSLNIHIENIEHIENLTIIMSPGGIDMEEDYEEEV